MTFDLWFKTYSGLIVGRDEEMVFEVQGNGPAVWTLE